jgi:hypothetical protein
MAPLESGTASGSDTPTELSADPRPQKTHTKERHHQASPPTNKRHHSLAPVRWWYMTPSRQGPGSQQPCERSSPPPPSCGHRPNRVARTHQTHTSPAGPRWTRKAPTTLLQQAGRAAIPIPPESLPPPLEGTTNYSTPARPSPSRARPSPSRPFVQTFLLQ